MQQIVLETPGRFAAAEVPAPSLRPGEALVRVCRIGVCGTDLHAFRGDQPFFTYPRVLGHELGVEVIDAGDDPTGLSPGDRCAVEPYLNCGRCPACLQGRTNCCAELKVLGVHIDGAMQPLLAVPSRKLHRSDRLDCDRLALVEMLGIGAHAVERGGIGPDDFALVVGAGPIGLGAIRFAQIAGARVAAMDVSAARLDFCRRELGVEHALAPGPDSAERLRAAGGGELPTVVIDATGSASSMAAAPLLAGHGGRVVFAGLVNGPFSVDDPNFHRRELTLLATRNSTAATFRRVIRLMEDGRVDTAAWITHRFALEETPRRFPELARDPAAIKGLIHGG